MEFSIVKWFKRKKNNRYDDIEKFMKQINGNVSVDVYSILSKLKEKEEENIKKLYYDIYNYLHLANETEDRISLIKNRYVLEAIASNVGNYSITSKIFEIVKNWDKDNYLPKSIRIILKNQIGDNEISELEELYKEYNRLKKDSLKDRNNYYYINSIEAKNHLTKSFGNLEKTSTQMVYIKDLDNRKKVSKEIISHIQELLSKKDFNGNPLSTIRLCKIRNVDNSNLDSDDLIKSIFNEGLIDSGDVITESNTTSIIKSIKDVLATFRTNDEGYSGYIILEIPSRFFQNNELKKEYEEELYKEDTSYLTIEPTYIDSYISINDRNYNLYSKEYFKKSKVKK